VEEDLQRMGVQNWKELAQDRDKWRDLVMAVKTLKEFLEPYEEEEEYRYFKK
jgi:hypothetical protein